MLVLLKMKLHKIWILNQSFDAYPKEELDDAFSVSLLDRLASGSLFGQEDERLGV